MNNIFISYRRADSADAVGRIYDHLKGVVGKESIFKDVHSVQLGIDYLKFTAEAVGACDVQLAIIGHQWLKGRRIDNPDDLVRVEIETALARDIPVIPVLVGGAEMPAQNELPDSLKPLVYRNAIKVRPDPDFPADMARLEAALKAIISLEPESRQRGRPWFRHWGSWAALFLIVAGGLTYFAFRAGPGERPSTINSAVDPAEYVAGDTAPSASVQTAETETGTGAGAGQDPAKVDRAMEFVDRYNGTGQLLDSRSRVSEATAGSMDAIAGVLKEPGLSDQELAAAYSNTILKLVEEERLGASLEQLFNFYEQLLICRDMQLCDEQVAAEFFDHEAGGFSRTFYPWVCQVRADWNNPAAFGRVMDFYLEADSAEVCD